ncbi:MAG: RNA methyltransferase [Oscillospiraceae bacterium]|jgi:TrmH family RNA methyltransferase|nr:RNA methyltransferase [Oscillospiraceae bacterium]
MQIIRSNDNAIVKRIVKLNSKKKCRQQFNEFVVEGSKLVAEAIRAGIKTKHCFTSEAFVGRHPKLIEQLKSCGSSVSLVAENLVKRLSTTQTPQEIYCICELPSAALPTHEAAPGKYLALIQLQNPDNLGAIIRTAAAFDLNGVYLSSDAVDIFSPKVLRASMGACFWQKITVISNLTLFLESCKNKSISTYSAVLANDSIDSRTVNFGEDAIIFMGNEGNGLPADIICATDHRIKISIASPIDSLNVAVAAGIFAWQLQKRNSCCKGCPDV